MPSTPPSASPVVSAPDGAKSIVASPAKTEVKIPDRPAEPRAARVYSILQTYCARCHQSGKTEAPLTSGAISNILDVDALARNRLLVRPGIPDASKLNDVLMSRHAPLDIYTALNVQPQSPPPASASEPSEPDTADIEAVRTWIKELPRETAACSSQQRITMADAEKLALEYLKSVKDDARDVRFLSLAHFYNGCANREAIAAYRQALIKLLNSLSWAGDPVPVVPLGPEGTILAFRLGDLGWVSGHWDILQRIYPATAQTPSSEALKSASGTDAAVFRGDWFADAAMKPPLYYALLGIPAKITDLAKINGVDIEQNIKSARARRMALKNSQVTRGNRVVERHEGARGAFWMVYDFSSSLGEQDVFERLLGPKQVAGNKSAFRNDFVRVMFALPNGFLANALYDTAGNRIDRALPGVEKQSSSGDTTTASNTTRAGSNCMECHVHGVKPVQDELRSALLAEKFAGGRDIKELALQLYAAPSETSVYFESDADRYNNALKAAGLDPAQLIDGIEPINALAKHYLANTDALGVAAELGIDMAQLQILLSEAPSAAEPLARRLQFSSVTRAEAESLIGMLQTNGAQRAAAKPAVKATVAGDAKPDTGSVKLNLWADKALAKPGDLVAIHAETDNDCYLTLVSVDTSGKATVIFPNDFETDNLLPAHKPVRVPGAEAPYQLRYKDKGQETVVGQCSTSPAPPVGIDYDFERQRFAVLGNWENFMHDALVLEADSRRNPDKAEKARAARAQALQQRRQDRGQGVERHSDPARPLRDGRAVIVIGNG